MSTYAKLAAAAIIALALAAFGWSMYHKGDVNGQATVQAKWDKQTAALSQQTTAAVQQAASDALANYAKAGASVQVAEQHQAEQATFQKGIIKRVQDYANNRRITEGEQAAGSNGTAGGGAAVPGSVATCGLDADGLRIWNDANAGTTGSGASSASDSASVTTPAVQ